MLRMFALFHLLITTSPLWAFETDYEIHVIAVEYPPFTSSKQPDGGLAFALLNDLTVNNKIEWKPLFLPPKRAYKTVESGDWCASFYPIFGENTFTKYKLGTDSESDFSTKFKRSGMNIANVETIESAINMVLLERVDIAMTDNISYSNLSFKDKEQLQFSESYLYETVVSIFINNRCDIPLLNLNMLNENR